MLTLLRFVFVFIAASISLGANAYFTAKNSDGKTLYFKYHANYYQNGQVVPVASLIRPTGVNAVSYSGIIDIPEEVYFPGDSRNPALMCKVISIDSDANDFKISYSHDPGGAFSYATELEGVIIPSSVKEIDARSFEGSSIRFIKFSNNEDLDIEPFAFRNCKNLTIIELPEKIRNLGELMFDGCDNLKTVTMPSTSSNISAASSYIHGGGATRNPEYSIFGNAPVTTLIVPNDISQWCGFSYSVMNKYHDDYYLPSSVKTLILKGNGCVSLPKSVSRDGHKYSYNLSGIENIIMSGDCLVEGEYCMSNSTLTPIYLDLSSAKKIGYFYGLSNWPLKKLKLPFIGIGSAENSTPFQASIWTKSLETIELCEGATNLNKNVLKGCTNIKELILPSSFEGMGEYALDGCSGITDIYISTIYPPAAYENTFDGMRHFQCVLHVPYGSKQYYEKADGWNRFYNIREDAPTLNIDNIQISVEGTNVKFVIDEIEGAVNYILRILDSFSGKVLFSFEESPQKTRNGEQIVFNIENLSPFTKYAYSLFANNADDEIIYNGTGQFETQKYTSSVITIEADNLEMSDIMQYFNMNGIEIKSHHLTPGIYIRRQGKRVSKIMIR
jgi:hypothetical protein